MRASTANRILWWIVGAMGAFALLLLVAGDPEGRQLLRYVVLIALTVGGLSWLGYHYRVLPRRDSFSAQARELGLRAGSGDPLGLLGMPFALFGWAASVREIENTATGLRRGEDLVVADCWFAPTGRAEYDDYQRYTCVLSTAPAGWPDVAVLPERIASRMMSTLGLPDIEMESERFNRRFEVRSADRRFTSALLDQRMMEWLLEQVPGVGFEVLGGRLMVFRPRVTTSLDDLARAVELHDGFLERVPTAVRSGV